ncbi:hypothetical protein [Pedobacter arcticus]|uniref:hypothetical protein n=1 Tax=Pedobacter arcticus TaxID=752140 RepID=UPI0002EA49BD|nr:hypothetical protein [Pedobacter arcticus]
MKKLLFVFLISCVSYSVDAQILAWNFLSDVKGNERVSASTMTDSNLEVSILSRGPGVKPEKASYSFASAFPVNQNKEEAIKAGSYYQFTVKTKKNHYVSLNALEVVLRVQNNAPRNYRWMYSTDGIKFTDLGKEDVKSAPTINNGVSQPTLNLSSYKELQGVSSSQTITFRLYAWGGAEGSKDNGFRIGKSGATRNALSLSGKVSKKK